MAHPPADFDDIPQSLRADLRELYPARAKSSPAIDQAIQNHARVSLARRRRLRLWLNVGVSAAAILLISAVLLPTMWTTDSGPGIQVARLIRNNSQLSGDVTGDSIVDIRDALTLQRAIERGMKGGVDPNHDGITDRRDVDAIAMMAVRIEGGAVR
jgi:hypothetical protein